MRLKDIDVVNWIAALIVILILVAFFWPQTDSVSTREVASQASKIESESFYSESRVDEPPTEQPLSPTFSRQDDLSRADDYRVQEAMERRIRDLHSLAEQQIESGELTEPDASNATSTYRQILLLNSKDVKAQQGLEYIGGRFLSIGLRALENNNLASASAALQKLEEVDADSEQRSELALTIERWQRQQEIDDLLAKAEAALSNDDLILPARKSALYYFQQVLTREQNNSIAIKGIQGIADNLMDRANLALVAGELQAATGYLTTVSVIDPEHPSLSLMEQRMARLQELENSTTTNGSNQVSDLDVGNEPQVQQPQPSANSQSPARTTAEPSRQSREQAEVDRKFLELGLDAYYKGDYSTAASLLQPLADRGISRAQFRIGYMYFQGRGFKQDKNEADRIIRAALPAVQKFADEGRSWAQSDIGSLYEDGLVLPRDYAEAVFWYRSAAEQGYPGAQTNLGIMYARGRGVSSSRRTAIEWFQRASKQGDILAKRNLEAMGIKP